MRRPVVYQGVQVTIRNPETGQDEPLREHAYSDGLLMFLLRGLRPDKYADRSRNVNENTNSGTLDVTPHPNLVAAARRANHHTPAWREMIRARLRERGNWLRPDTVPWTAEQDALLGTALDAEVARRLGRMPGAVCARRRNLGIAPHLVPVDGLALRLLRLKAGLSQAALAKLAGVHRAKPGELETGRERSLPRASLERMAAALGCEAIALTARGRSPNTKQSGNDWRPPG